MAGTSGLLIRSTFCIAALLALLTQPRFVSAQSAHCDPGLRIAADNPVHYQTRGSPRDHNERCEGVYVKEVAGSTLFIASFTSSFGEYDLNSGAPLHVSWPSVAEPVRVRAYSLRDRVYYRMDSQQPPAAGAFNWPISVLAALDVRPADLGVIGWVQRTIGSAKRDVYLPLDIYQATAASKRCCRVVLLPGRELDEVFLTLAPVGSTGVRGKPIRDAAALQYGFYPAGRAIVIPITGMPAPGLYVAELAATLRGGGSTVVELWFHNPAK